MALVEIIINPQQVLQRSSREDGSLEEEEAETLAKNASECVP